MRIEVDIPEALYRKFQAALLIREEEENTVMVQQIMAYINSLFPSHSEKPQSNYNDTSYTTQIAPSLSPAQIAHAQQFAFLQWFQNQTHGQGKSYSPITINSYTDKLASACQDPTFASISPKNLFEITDPAQFHSIRSSIMSCANFASFDSQSHGAFTAALNMYAKYLNSQHHSSLSTMPAIPVTPRPKTATAPHRWTWEENELCCRRYFQTFIVAKSPESLTDFAIRLHRELPAISVNSLKMKAQNIKQLCILCGILDSLQTTPLQQYSTQCSNTFSKVKKEFGF